MAKKVIKDHIVFGDICLCDCHKYSNRDMYFNGCGCCDVAEKKYIEDDGTVNAHDLYLITREVMQRYGRR